MFKQLLEKIASALDRSQILYMIIGGQAVLLYGEPRLTKDIDITLGAGLERLGDVTRLVRQLALKPLADPEDFTRKTMVLPCEDPGSGIRVDFIFSSSPYEKEALERARSVKLGNREVRFATLEDLIVHKIIAGRSRDLEDVRGIILKNSQADFAYVRKWLKEFSASLGQPFLEEFERLTNQIPKK